MMIVPLLVVVAAVLIRMLLRRNDGRLATAGEVASYTPTVVVRVPRNWPTIRALGTGEVRRLFSHPLVLIGVALGILSVGLSPGDEAEAYYSLTGNGAAGLYLPTMTFLAATLIAARARRNHTTDLLASTPANNVDRTLALAVTGVLAAVAVLAGLLLAYAAYRVFGVEIRRNPGPLELLPLPLTVLGSVTLGSMIGRWLPFRGAGPLVLFGLVTLSTYLTGDTGHPSTQYFATFVEFQPSDGGNVAVPFHLIAGHDLYLLGLDAMAVIGAVLHDSRSLRWWVAGFCAVVFTAAMGAWQIS